MKRQEVAPFTGAWIEMILISEMNVYGVVAPFTGAWIEIFTGVVLKMMQLVAPFTGAWIEISICSSSKALENRRSLHGGVD